MWEFLEGFYQKSCIQGDCGFTGVKGREEWTLPQIFWDMEMAYRCKVLPANSTNVNGYIMVKKFEKTFMVMGGINYQQFTLRIKLAVQVWKP